MDFGYYTFPIFLIPVAFGLYFWQEPRMRDLDKGRVKLLEKMVADIFNAKASEAAQAEVFTLLCDAYVKHKDILMPIRKFVPYRRIKWCLSCAMALATVCAIWNPYLKQLNFVDSSYLSLSVNGLFTGAITVLSAFPAYWLFDEFRYMRRIIDLFDGHNHGS